MPPKKIIVKQPVSVNYNLDR